MAKGEASAKASKGLDDDDGGAANELDRLRVADAKGASDEYESPSKTAYGGAISSTHFMVVN